MSKQAQLVRGRFFLSFFVLTMSAHAATDFSEVLVMGLYEADEKLLDSELDWKSSEALASEGDKPYSVRAYSNAFQPDYEGFPDQSNFQYTVGAEGQLPYGLNLETEFSQRLQGDSEPEIQINTTLNLWPNLVGRQDRKSAERVRLQETATRMRLSEQQGRVCLASYASYLDWVEAQSSYQVARDSFLLSEEVFRELRKQFQRKQIRELQFRSAEVDMEQARLDLAEAQLNLDKLTSDLQSRLAKEVNLTFPDNFEKSSMQMSFDKLYGLFAVAGETPTGSNTAQLLQQATLRESEAADLAWDQKALAFGPQLSAFYRFKDGDFSSQVSRETSVGLSLEWRFWDSGHRAESISEEFAVKKRQLQLSALQRRQALELSTDNLSLIQKPARLQALEKQAQLQKKQLLLARQDLEFGRIDVDVYLGYRNAADAAELKHIRELSSALEDLLEWRLIFQPNQFEKGFCSLAKLTQEAGK